ncbi:DUF3833 domain-containing protein [Chitinilyticum litopenaei]|uniref:DUF3833 domain-containing protein n=1 Tax=Chitinilyticum litopenaei TaxID=1121276 RepID=UPI0003F72684|nr:DUF3833 domain-containing protein [Chitinilyticum litopenaei]
MKKWLCMLTLGLAGCAGVDVDTYRNEAPPLRLEQYFTGTIDGWGQFQKRDGTVVKRFKVVIDASWQGNTGTLDEHFRYSDGSTGRRVWTITAHPDGRYTGTASDVVGEAEGRVAGNALHWRYRLNLPVDGKVYEVEFDDWMWLQEDDVLLNRSVMRKFGFDLGEVFLSFKKRDQ